jgi:RNA polymerase sigma-70 factor (ECF subfamily)
MLSTALAPAPQADATRLLYERHSSRIFGFCLSRLGSREEAEDAVQTTFMNAQRGLGRGVVPEYELAWLFKIAQNVCHNRHQSARRRGRVEAAHDLDSLQDVIASPERGASVSLGELTHALGAIPSRQRRALLLREFQGYSYEEIADELGISVAAVETLLFRARRAVARELELAGAVPARRRSGAFAPAFELLRWLFGGGAAPLKIAAVTAAVATGAGLAVIPTVRDHGSAPAEPSIASTPPVQLPSSPKRTVPERTGQLPPRAPAVSQSVAPARPVPPSAAPASASALPPHATTAPAGTSEPAVPGPVETAPSLSVEPELTAPTVTVPELPLPEANLPDVTLPDAQLPPVSLPPVPQLP